MKKILLAVVILTLTLCFTACRDGGNIDDNNGTKDSSSVDNSITSNIPDSTSGSIAEQPTDSSELSSDNTTGSSPIEPDSTDTGVVEEIGGLNDAQKNFIKGLGATVENERLVCMSESKDYATYWVYTFNNGKISKGEMFTIAKSAAFFETLITTDTSITDEGINRELLYVFTNLTDEYKDKTYSEILLLMSSATVVTGSK